MITKKNMCILHNITNHIKVYGPLLLMGCVVLYWLSLNFYAQRLCDEVSQVSQWRLFCGRGAVALVVLAIASVVSRKCAQSVPTVMSWSIVIMGVMESVVAFKQLYGYGFSNNALYRETGTFYNPGPLGGYIAVCIPVALALWRMTSNRWLSNVALGALVVMITIEPSTMSRSGWIAALAGSIYVLLFTEDIINRLQAIGKRRLLIMTLGLVVISLLSAYAVWHIKSNSAYGRLFLWKISCMAIAKSPMIGHETFAKAYGDAQESYFDSGGSEWERLVAGSPDYAFNEFLHYAVVWGVPAMLAIVALIVTAIVVGHKRRRYWLCGAVISLCVFACSSYPMHIPAIVATGCAAMLGCLYAEGRLRYVLSVVMISCGVFLWMQQATFEKRQDAMQRWDKTKWYYTSKRYRLAVQQYERVAEDMEWNGRYMFEYGHSLHNDERHEESNEVLAKAMLHSSDPMILNIIGKNYQAMGRYEEAESCFRRSISRLPERVYPHYLLFLLYSEDGYFDEEKRRVEADIILDHKWKVESDATKEIREKVKERLEDS